MTTGEPTPEAPKIPPPQTEQKEGGGGVVEIPAPSTPEPTSATSGRRPALGNLRREVLDAELSHPGVQKLLLDRLDSAEAECGELREFVEKFHLADKDAAVLRAQLRTGTAFEILCAGGFGCGGILIGIGPSLLTSSPTSAKIIIAIGVVFVIASTLARLLQVKR
jgi:hypothetical protein